MDPERLEEIPLFAELTGDERRRLAHHADEIDIPRGKVLAEEGDFAYEFFVITAGRAEVRRTGALLAELGPGDFFGEIGLLETDRRTATVKAMTPMRAITIYGPHFRRFEREMPVLAERVRKAIRERLARRG